jgi:hypothetical protein
VGDAYFLLSALAGEDLITGTKLSPSEQLQYAGMAAFSLATMIIGSGIFSQEALAATRAVEELGELERVGAELARGAEDEARAMEAAAKEGRAAEGVAREASDAGAVGRDLSEVRAGGDVGGAAASDLASGAGAAPSLHRPGGAGPRLPMSMDTVNSVAQKHGIDLSENNIRINKAIQGRRGSTARNLSITLYRDAFENEEELAKTLVHEQYHVQQLRAGMPYPESYDATSVAETEAENFAIAWWESVMGR